MHSLIIGLTTNESNQNLKLSENDFDLYKDFSDYVRELRPSEFQDSLDWFKNYLACKFEDYIEIEGKTFKFKSGAVRNYFYDMKDKVLRLIEESEGNFKNVRWKILNAINDEFGFHIDFEGDVDTFDDFMSWAEEDTTYYIYDILDYHN